MFAVQLTECDLVIGVEMLAGLEGMVSSSIFEAIGKAVRFDQGGVVAIDVP